LGRVLSIDYGEKRMGIAISDPNKIIAQNFKTLKYKNLEKIVEEISDIIERFEVERVVVGNPIGLSGAPTQESKRVEEFIRFLKKRVKVEIELFDERFSTKLAERILRISKERSSRKKGLKDRIAASIILQDYLDSKR